LSSNNTNLSAVKITGEDLQQTVTNVSHDWINENDGTIIDGETFNFSTINSNGVEIKTGVELERVTDSESGELDDGSADLMQDALYDFDFNEADVELLLQ